MSWRLLLSEYPESLLKDPLPVALLVLIERAGMATEEVLQKEIGLPQEDLVSLLLSLHNSKLIEYARQHILLSDRGKQFLDRFDLRDEIVSELLKDIPLESSQRATLEELIASYRAQHFHKYLDSVRATRHWVQLCRNTTVAPELTKATALGRLAIIAHDISHTLLHKFEDIEREKRPSDVWEKALLWLQWKEEAASSSKPLLHLKEHHPLEVQLWSLHCESRLNLETELWDLEWSSKTGRWAQAMEACQSTREITDRLASYWTDRIHFHRIEEAHSRIEAVANRLELLPTKIDHLFLFLFSASTIEELSETSQIPQAALEPILRQIRSKCEALLETETILHEQQDDAIGEQVGADQPATAPESNREGDENTKPESEGRSR